MSPKTTTILYALIADIVLVVVFALIGRSQHGESLNVTGILETAWPFLAGLVIGWLICRSWKFPLRIWPQAFCLWLITVAAGMALRIVSGNTAEIAFVIVTMVVLAVFLWGHRFLANLVLRRR